ncbi:MAG: DUF58 domain-containing protein [Desulfobacterales bacterium]|nr:DUF58 domain-containing protein [Desulfobacterales bacterium]
MTAGTEDKLSCAYTLPLILALVGLVLFMALLTRQLSLTFLCILVFTMAAGAKAWSRLSIIGIQSELRIDKKKMFPGETLALSIGVANNKILPVWLQVRVALKGALQTASGQTALRKDSGLLWYQRVSFNWQLTAVKRGVHRIGPVVFEVGDLLGFYPQIEQAPDFHDVIVYPRLVQLNPIRLPRRDFFGIPGVRSPIEDPIYIHGTRDYQSRRPARYIHWKASARHNRLMEKVCEPAEQEKILMLVCTDRFSSDHTGEAFERALEVAASLAVQLDRMRFVVGLASNGRLKGGGNAAVKISRNPGHLSDILETMARLEPVPAGEMVDILQRGLTLPWGVTAVCFTCRLDGASLALNQYFNRRNIPMVMIVCDHTADLTAAETKTNEKIYRLDDIRVKGPAI